MFTTSHHRHTCHSHLLHSFILQHSSPTIVWAHPAPFYSDSYTHWLGLHISPQLTSQRLYTLFRLISHVAESLRPCHTLLNSAFAAITHLPLPLCSFFLSQCLGCRTPRTYHTVVTLSHHSHTLHSYRVWFFVLWCTALYRTTVSVLLGLLLMVCCMVVALLLLSK